MYRVRQRGGLERVGGGSIDVSSAEAALNSLSGDPIALLFKPVPPHPPSLSLGFGKSYLSSSKVVGNPSIFPPLPPALLFCMQDPLSLIGANPQSATTHEVSLASLKDTRLSLEKSSMTLELHGG